MILRDLGGQNLCIRQREGLDFRWPNSPVGGKSRTPEEHARETQPERQDDIGTPGCEGYLIFSGWMKPWLHRAGMIVHPAATARCVRSGFGGC